MASGPAGRKLDLPVTASCGDGGGAAVYRWWRQRRQRQRRRGPGAGAQGVEKGHDVAAAGTEDSCLVRERQHHAARPQELAHPGRGNGKCRGEQPSRLSRPASCRVPEPWEFKASVHVSLQWGPAKALAPGGTPGGTGGTPVLPSSCRRTRVSRSAAETDCNTGAAPLG